MANEIGKVAVRVYPDTTGFATETKRKLQRLRDQKYPVQVEVDEDKLNRQIKLMVAKLNATLAERQNHIRFKADLDLTNAEARNQVGAARKKYQAMADAARDVSFDSKLKSDMQDSEIRVTPKIDQEQFTRDLQRAVKQATRNNDDISIWGDDGQIRSQADRAASIFRQRLAQANEKTSMFGDRAKMEADARKSATSIRESFRVAFKDFNLFGKKGDIEDDAVTALDIFKRKWKAAQGKLNIRADLEFDQAGLEAANEELAVTERRYARTTDLLAAQGREYKRIVAEAARVRKEMDAARQAMDKIVKNQPGGLQRWKNATEELRKQEQIHENMVVWSRELADRNSKLVKSIEVDSASLVDSEAKVEEWRKRIEINSITLDVDLRTAASEAWLEFITRPRVIQIWTKVRDAGLRDTTRLWGLISRHTANTAKNGTKWMAQLTGIRVLWHTFKDMVEWLPRLDMMVPQLASQVALLGVGAAGAIGAFGTLVNLVSDLAEVGKIALLAPAGLAGLALTAYSLNMAFANIADLAPAAAQAMEDFDLAIAEGVWNSPGGKQTAKFIEDLFNGLTSMSPQIGAALGGALAALSEGIASVGPKGGIRFIENYIKGFKNAERGLESLGGALATMGVVGSDVFGDLGTWFSDVMEDFDSWTKENAANGNLERWIRDAGTAMLELISIMDSTVRVFGNMSRAFKAAGFPGLTEMAAGMKSLAESTRELEENGEFMFTLDAVAGFFETMADKAGSSFKQALSNAWRMLGRSLNTLAQPIAGALDAIFDGFNSGKFQEGFENLIDGIGSFLKDVSPGLEALTGDLGSLLGVVGTAAESWGPAFNDMLLMFSSAGDKLHPGLVEFIEKTGPDLQKLVQDITPHIEDFAEAISDLLGNENFQDLVGDLIGDLGLVMTAALRLGTAIVNLAERFSDWYGSLSEGEQATVRWAGIMAGAFGGVTLAIAGLAFKIAPVATAKALGKAFVWIAKALGRFVMNFVRAVTGLGLLVRDAVKGLFKLPAVRTVLGGVGRFFRGLGPAILKLLPKGLQVRIAAGLARILPAGGLRLLAGVAIRRFLGILAGPLGWALIIASIVKPTSAVEMADAVTDAMGLGDTWYGRFSDSLKKNFREAFGDKTLLDMAIENLVEAWGHFSAGDFVNGVIDAVFGNPIDIFAEIMDALLETLGLDEGLARAQEYWPETFGTGGVGGFFDAQFQILEDKLQEGWDWFIDKIKNWNPISLSFRFAEWFVNKLREWLGLGGKDPAAGSGGGSSAASYLGGANMISGLGDSFLDGVGSGFRELAAKILGWTPGGDGIDWWALLKKWLFGANPFGGIASGVAGVIGGALPALLEGIGSGVSTLKDGIKGLVMAPVTLGGKIKDWVLGKSPIAGVGDNARTAITSESGALMGGINSGIATLKEMVLAGTGSGEGVGGSVIDKALGVDELAAARTRDRFTRVSERFKQFGGTVLGTFGGIHQGGRREIEGLSDTTDTEFGAMQMGGERKTSGMSGSVIGNLGSMASGVIGKITGMSSGTSSEFSSMKSDGTSKTASMQSAVVAKMGVMAAQAGAKAAAMSASVASKLGSMGSKAGAQMANMAGKVVAQMASMQSRGVAQIVRFQGAAVRAIASASRSIVAQGRSMASGFAAAMAQMASRAMSIVGSLRGRLAAGLRINAHGAGSFTGSTFVSGLAGGLSRAAGIARSMAGRIRSALSFSTYSSGSTVGGTFASGIASRIGAVASAASRLAAAARSRMPNSPAKEGPFSGSGWGGWGESIGDELARGLKKATPAVAKEAEALMGGVSNALGARSELDLGVDFSKTRKRYSLAADTAAAANAGNVIQVNVESRSDEPFEEAVRFANDLRFALEGVII